MTTWDTSTIGVEFSVQLGKRVDAAVARGVPKLCINNRGVRWGRVDPSVAAVELLTETDIRELRLIEGDVLVCEGGEIGRSSVWHGETPEAYYLNTLHRLRSKKGYEPELAAAFLEYFVTTGALKAIVGKSSLAHLTKENPLRVPLPVPPRTEQMAIGSALRSVDDLKVSLERLIAKKDDVKQSMMQELLAGRTRLPGFAGDWSGVRLGDVLTVRHGRDQKSVEVPGGRYKILATGGQIGTTDTPLYSKPSVLIGRKGTIDRPLFQDEPFWSVDTLFYTDIGEHADPKYLFYVFQTIDWRSMNEASGVPSLNSARIEAVEVNLPAPNEQRAIRTLLDDVDAEIEALERCLESAREVKVGMMQELLTGRTRMPAEEEA